MKPTQTDPQSRLEMLESLVFSATQHASRAMTQWTNGQVNLSMDKLVEVGLEEVTEMAELGEELMTMVVFGIDGPLPGQLILAFDDANGRELSASLIGKEIPDDPNWTPLEQSAIMETGNILASAYLNEMTRITREQLKPSAPTFVQDFGGSVLAQALIAQAMYSDKILICQTRFEFNSKDVNWSVYFLPGPELIECLKSANH